jgi:hypothetical protein
LGSKNALLASSDGSTVVLCTEPDGTRNGRKIAALSLVAATLETTSDPVRAKIMVPVPRTLCLCNRMVRLRLGGLVSPPTAGMNCAVS